MSTYLKDSTGIYLLATITSIHPINIRGDKQDQTLVTQTLTQICTLGGQTVNTTIPYDAASSILIEFWTPVAAPAPGSGATPPPATGSGNPPPVNPPPAPAPAAPSAASTLAKNVGQFSG